MTAPLTCARCGVADGNVVALQLLRFDAKPAAAHEDAVICVEALLNQRDALRAEVERWKNDALDALDLKDGKGPTVLTMLVRQRDALRAELVALRADAGKLTPEALALKFHENYERLAPSFGYETRQETRAFDPTSANGRLMIAVCAEITSTLAARAEGK